MEGKTEEEVERYAKVFKERYKELNGNIALAIVCLCQYKFQCNLILNLVWLADMVLFMVPSPPVNVL